MGDLNGIPALPRNAIHMLVSRWHQGGDIPTMVDTKWAFRALGFTNCNCSYGCPCQFNALPTHGFCCAVTGFGIKEGHHGSTKLDGLKVAGMFRWPGPIHEGRGESAVVIDKRADETQRTALLRILSGQ